MAPYLIAAAMLVPVVLYVLHHCRILEREIQHLGPVPEARAVTGIILAAAVIAVPFGLSFLFLAFGA